MNLGRDHQDSHYCYDLTVSEPGSRSTKGARPESREASELRAIRARNPELESAVDLHLELLELQRRVQSRLSLPWIPLSPEVVQQRLAEAKPLLRFEDVSFEVSDLRLMVRQTADVLRRFGALEAGDFDKVQALGRDANLMDATARWYRKAFEQRAAPVGVATTTPGADADDSAIDSVLGLAMRPFLSRCAEVLQQRPELSQWTHPHCAMCGGEPDFAYITPSAERQLICGRCGLRWKWKGLACPYCGNDNRDQITSFATPDGHYRISGCDVCHRYLKAYDGRHSSRPVMPVVDSVATLPLDAVAMQRGYSA
jgi:FdhE protein